MSAKNILIIAAERGLGLGLAEQFFHRGWSVVGTARPGADVQALREVGRSDPSRLAIAPRHRPHRRDRRGGGSRTF